MFDISTRHSQSESSTLELRITKVLDEIIGIGGVESVILASRDGFPMFSRQGTPIDSDDELLVSAMLSGLMVTVEGANKRLGRQTCQLVTIESDDGYIVVCETYGGAVLAVTTTRLCKLGLLHFILKQAEKQITQFLSSNEGLSNNS